MEATKPASPYAATIPPGARDVRVPGQGKPKLSGEGVPQPADLKTFLDTVTSASERIEANVERLGAAATVREISADTGGEVVEKAVVSVATPEQKTAPFDDRTMSKVLAFLDNNMMAPTTVLGPIRHKFFVVKVPTQQELLDVTAFTGARVRDAAESMTQAEFAYSVIGELLKACAGWISERAPGFDLLRQNIAQPKLWPTLQPIAWLATRDPYVLEEEILPLWTAYQAWKLGVVPTKDEVDFYFANRT